MQLIPLAIGVGLAFAAGYIQRKQAGKREDVFQDDSPVNLATRGSFIPYVLGRARTGALFTWVGNRQAYQQVVGRTGGKGSKSKKTYQTVYYEEGMHILSLGPVQTLHRVLANGQEVFTGPITPNSHPSGTRVESSIGGFDMYWGETDQPINTYLGDPGQNQAHMGVQSRWPLVCYVVWRPIRLGTSAAWPNITYEIETEIQVSGLVRSSPTISAPGQGTGTIFNITGTSTLGGPDDRYLIPDYHADELPARGFVLLRGNTAAADGTYLIGSSENLLIGNVAYTRVKLLGLLGQTPTPPAPVSGDGTLELVSSSAGVNPAHVLYQLLFGGYPYGMGFDPADFDLNSLENLGVTAQNEGFRSAFAIYDGQTILTLVSAVLQDLGCVLPFDVNNGTFKFQLVRPSTIPIPVIPLNMQTQFPEFEVLHRALPVNKLMFTYRDQDRRFREMTITLDDDGAAQLVEQQRSEKINIASALDYLTAARIAERRSQEELANNNVITLHLTRTARRLIPGRIFKVEGIEEELIVVTTQINTESGEVVIKAIPNYYAAQEVTPTEEAGTGGGQAGTGIIPGPDVLVNFFEAPALLLNGEPTTVFVLRVRGSTGVVGGQIYISRDDVTYQYEVDQNTAMAGGTLTTPLAIDSDSILEIGPEFTAQGPDIGSALDLTGDNVNWRAGRQKALLNDEIMFVRNVEALGGSLYRLRGVIRARYDTKRELHPAGRGVILFQDADLSPIQDILLEPNFPLYVKSQPVAATAFPLDSLDPVLKTLKGKGVVPMDPVNLRVQGQANVRRTGLGVLLKWSYRSGAIPGTGAGLQSYGAPVGTSPIEGDFTLEIMAVGGEPTPRLTVSGITSTSHFLSDGLLLSLFSNLSVGLRARLKNVNGGFESASIFIDIVKIAG